jgi:hypothetical protein
MMVLLDVVGVYAQATQIGGLICGGVSLRRSNQIWDPKSKWKTERYIGGKNRLKGRGGGRSDAVRPPGRSHGSTLLRSTSTMGGRRPTLPPASLGAR